MPPTSANALIDENFVPEELHPKLLELREGIMASSTNNQQGLGKVVLDIVDDIIKAGVPTSPVELLPFFNRFAGLRRRKSKIRQVVVEVLSNLLDPTFKYEMTLGNVVAACCNAGANLTPSDHGNIYRGILTRLRTGVIRDYCVQNGLIRYLNKKLEKVDDNYRVEKARGTIL